MTKNFLQISLTINTSVYRKQEFSYNTAIALHIIYTVSKTLSKDDAPDSLETRSEAHEQ